MSLYAYRLVVESWPTDDGEPWARFYGDTAAVPNHEIPEWLEKVIAEARAVPWSPSYYRSVPWRIVERLRIDDADEVVGVLLPKVHRRHYLSASGVHELARDMRAFGAVVTVQRSAAITDWTDVPAGVQRPGSETP